MIRYLVLSSTFDTVLLFNCILPGYKNTIDTYFSLIEFDATTILSLSAIKNSSSRVDKKYFNMHFCKIKHKYA